MRTLTFDQFEFENSSTEESLELWIAAKSRFPFPNVRAFGASAATVDIAAALKPATPMREFGYADMVRDYLWRFAGLTVPDPCDWPTYVLSSDTCDWDAVFEAPDYFIRFHWFTTA